MEHYLEEGTSVARRVLETEPAVARSRKASSCRCSPCVRTRGLGHRTSCVEFIATLHFPSPVCVRRARVPLPSQAPRRLRSVGRAGSADDAFAAKRLEGRRPTPTSGAMTYLRCLPRRACTRTTGVDAHTCARARDPQGRTACTASKGTEIQETSIRGRRWRLVRDQRRSNSLGAGRHR